MYEYAAESNDRSLASKLLAFFVACAVALSCLTLAGCGGSKEEQDNCYGEDMPVINE